VSPTVRGMRRAGGAAAGRPLESGRGGAQESQGEKIGVKRGHFLPKKIMNGGVGGRIEVPGDCVNLKTNLVEGLTQLSMPNLGEW